MQQNLQNNLKFDHSQVASLNLVDINNNEIEINGKFSLQLQGQGTLKTKSFTIEGQFLSPHVVKNAKYNSEQLNIDAQLFVNFLAYGEGVDHQENKKYIGQFWEGQKHGVGIVEKKKNDKNIQKHVIYRQGQEIMSSLELNQVFNEQKIQQVNQFNEFLFKTEQELGITSEKQLNINVDELEQRYGHQIQQLESTNSELIDRLQQLEIELKQYSEKENKQRLEQQQVLNQIEKSILRLEQKVQPKKIFSDPIQIGFLTGIHPFGKFIAISQNSVSDNSFFMMDVNTQNKHYVKTPGQTRCFASNSQQLISAGNYPNSALFIHFNHSNNLPYVIHSKSVLNFGNKVTQALAFAGESLLQNYDTDMYIFDLNKKTSRLLGKSAYQIIPFDNNLVSSSYLSDVLIYDLRTSSLAKKYTPHKLEVLGMDYNPNSGQLYSVGEDKIVRAWNWNQNSEEIISSNSKNCINAVINVNGVTINDFNATNLQITQKDNQYEKETNAKIQINALAYKDNDVFMADQSAQLFQYNLQYKRIN